MSGIVGFVDPTSLAGAVGALERMREVVSHTPEQQRGVLFRQGAVHCTASSLAGRVDAADPISQDDVHVWLDGEIYSVDGADYGEGYPPRDPRHELIKLYRASGDFDFLRNADGLFSAVIFDARRQKVHLITDRHGFRHLYYSCPTPGVLVWGSELKAFLESPGFAVTIDRVTVRQFFAIGHPLEGRTWFEGVSLIPAATALTLDLETNELRESQYWSWANMPRPPVQPSVKQAARQLGALFRQAVQRRVRFGERISLTLSGGLDSRAILAAVPLGRASLIAVTFGDKNSSDIRFARLAASARGVPHRVVEIGADNWFLPRFRGVWLCDGSVSLEHLHGIEALPVLWEAGSVNLHGFGGDICLGGNRLRNASYFDTGATRSVAAECLHCSAELVPFDGVYPGGPKVDAFILNNRGRRFTYEGVKADLTVAEQRFPFFDNALFEYVYSLPDSYRYEGRLYRRMLLDEFPSLFRTIPWQKTGWTIDTPKWLMAAGQFVRRASRKAKRILPMVHGIDTMGRGFTDYAAWIRLEPARSAFSGLLLDKDARYREFVDGKDIENLLREHLEGRNNTARLCLAMTFEIWLRQVFDGELRDGELADRNHGKLH